MKGDKLGEFEELVLLTVYSLDSDAYGVRILEKLEEDAQRRATIGAVYSALSRLESKGCLQSRLGGITRERGGRRKRFFRITPMGIETLEQMRQVRERIWRQLEGKLEVPE
jgi:DNA-binding PadR family transcriptional regulator